KLGNIAILPVNLTDSNHDGLVDDPDENNYGGKQVYAFDEPVHIGSFLFIDKDHGTPDKAIAYDVGGNVLTTALIPVAGNGSVSSSHPWACTFRGSRTGTFPTRSCCSIRTRRRRMTPTCSSISAILPCCR